LILILHFPKFATFPKIMMVSKFRKKYFSRMIFFVKLNGLTDVYEKVKNLLSRVRIYDLTFLVVFYDFSISGIREF